ncbi:MAG TPA: hypothetical protein PLG47_06245, partial [Candidatus Dojkabacteria bacterium]|nr:hypothetical protein [Candidatus Dojkabacteria bacterium]
MRKTHPIVMLPTEKAEKSNTSIYLNHHSKQLILGWMNARSTNQTPQHLYILSSETIQEGDWYIDNLVHPNLITEPLQMKCWCNKQTGIIQSTVGTTSPVSTSKKIIATTDKSLNQLGIMCADKSKAQPCINIPQIPESFLPIFVEAYNSGKPITEVELEYTTDNNIEGYPEFGGNGILKTTESNEVIISLPLTLDNIQLASEQFSMEIERNKNVKMYSRDEVETLCR